jgi:hypothetical protein
MEIIENRRRRRNTIAALGFGLVLLALSQVLVTGQARAESAACGGSIVRAGQDLHYTVSCRDTFAANGTPNHDKLKSYAIMTNRDVDGFDTEINVINGSGSAVNGESFSCEGPLPSPGFSCGGNMSAGNIAPGGFTPDIPVCHRDADGKKFKAWLLVSVLRGTSTVASGPIPMSTPRCHGSKKGHHHSHHHHEHSHHDGEDH